MFGESVWWYTRHLSTPHLKISFITSPKPSSSLKSPPVEEVSKQKMLSYNGQ